MSFFNTTNLSGEDLKQAVQQASNQEDAVLLLYKNTGKAYSPSQVTSIMAKAGHICPLTSWRRCITNLTNKGELMKLNEQREGIYGKPEYRWQIKNGN